MNFSEVLRAGKLQSGLQNAKRENRYQNTIGFHDRNGGPKCHFAPKPVLKSFKNIGREHGVGRVAQNVCLPVVFQRFGGTRIAPLGHPD